MPNMQLMDRLAELPHRFSPPTHAERLSWLVPPDASARVSITWPTQYLWPLCAAMSDPLAEALARHGVIRMEPTPQLHEGVVMLRCTVDGRTQAVAWDYADYHNLINAKALAECDLYFKCQFREEGYADARIIRGGYMVTNRRYYQYFMPYRRRGNAQPNIDVLARFGYEFQGDFRRRAVSLLKEALGERFVGSSGKVRYSRFLRESAGARLSLHMPGNGPFTHRVAEFLGLGGCMLSVRFATALHVPLVPGTHYVEIADDLSDMVAKVQYYLSNNAERSAIATAGRDYFDQYLHVEQVAAYYIRILLDRFGAR